MFDAFVPFSLAAFPAAFFIAYGGPNHERSSPPLLTVLLLLTGEHLQEGDGASEREDGTSEGMHPSGVFFYLRPSPCRPEHPLDEGSLTRVAASFINCQPERVDKRAPLFRAGGLFFFGRTEPPASRPSDGGSVAPALQINWSSFVVTLLRQGETHHLTLIDRPTGQQKRWLSMHNFRLVSQTHQASMGR